MATYKVLVGINYGKPEKRVEAGDLVDDIPVKSLPWLLEQGIVELASDDAPAKKSSKKSDEEKVA